MYMLLLIDCLILQEDDIYFNRVRIIVIMDLGFIVWVGIGEGNLIIYEILEYFNLKILIEVFLIVEYCRELKVLFLNNNKQILKIRSVIKSKSFLVLCSKQIRKKFLRYYYLLGSDFNKFVLLVKSELINKLMNSFEVEFIGSFIFKNFFFRYSVLRDKKFVS